jgi:hypothetical protein
MTDDPTQPTPVQTAFFVVVGTDGVISVHTDQIPAVTMTREATLYDIETYGSQLVRNVSRLISSQMVIRGLSPEPEPSIADRVSEALKSREEA